MKAADLFAGLGGFSLGAERAGARVVYAANHWAVACETYAANHGIAPDQQDLQQKDFTLVPEHELLLASPACQGHAWARGVERAHHDACRSTAWAVVTCAEVHRQRCIIVENVPEFTRWVLFPAWKAALEALGYAVAIYVLDAADHGVAQNRVRVFVICTRSAAPLELTFERTPAIAARDIIDFSAGTWSEASRKVPATREKIARGRQAFGDRFLISYYGTGRGRSLDRPVGTITTRDRWGVIDGDRMRMLSVDEAKRAMGFPSSFALPSNHKLAVHLLGNAVPPPLAETVVRAVTAAA